MKVNFYSKDVFNNVIYFFYDINDEILYIGRAKNLLNRLESHEHLDKKCYNAIHKVKYIQFDSFDDLDLAEPYYIAKHKPQYNKDFKNKHFSLQIAELDEREQQKKELKNFLKYLNY